MHALSPSAILPTHLYASAWICAGSSAKLHSCAISALVKRAGRSAAHGMRESSVSRASRDAVKSSRRAWCAADQGAEAAETAASTPAAAVAASPPCDAAAAVAATRASVSACSSRMSATLRLSALSTRTSEAAKRRSGGTPCCLAGFLRGLEAGPAAPLALTAPAPTLLLDLPFPRLSSPASSSLLSRGDGKGEMPAAAAASCVEKEPAGASLSPPSMAARGSWGGGWGYVGSPAPDNASQSVAR